MSSFLRALSKIGLVELDEEDRKKINQKNPPRSAPSDSPPDEDEIERILRETRATMDGVSDTTQEAATPQAAPPTPDPIREDPPPPPVGPVSEEDIDALIDGRTLEQIYTLAGITEAPYPVEKLLKVLDGLKAMPAQSRKMAVMAMDAADDNWSMADVILDAQRKSRALRQEQSRLEGVLGAAEQQARVDLEAKEAYQQQATAAIREQIAELEAMLAQEVQQVSEQKSAIKARIEKAREAARREHTRLDEEIRRISEVPITFGDSGEG